MSFAADGVAMEAIDATDASAAPAVVPGADLAPAPHSAAPGGARPRPDLDDADAAATAEWTASAELGAGDAPTTAARRGAVPDDGRRVSDRALGVVPPSEAWPDDVWTEAVASPTDPTEQAPPVTVSNEVAPVAADDATSGSRAEGPGPTLYPPAVPDAPDDYALDGTQGTVGSPSPVYLPDAVAGWSPAPVDGPTSAPTGRARQALGTDAPAPADESELAARLRVLADELERRAIGAPGYTPGMRDSEALVTLLGALLRAER